MSTVRARKMPLDSAVLKTDLDANGKNIRNLDTPVEDSDAATKKYVDDHSGGGSVTLDDTVTEDSAHGVKSSGIWSWVKGLLSWGNITGKPETFTPSNHLHSQSAVTGLLDALASKLDKTGGVMTGALESSANGEIAIVDQDGNTKYTKTGILRDKSVGGSTQINGLTLNFPDKSGTLAVTSEIPSVDSTLAVSGAASDAKKVGDKLKEKASAKVGASVVLKNGDGSILSLSTSDPTSASLGSLVYCFFLGTVDITGSVTSIAFNGETGKVVVTSSDSYPTLEFDVGSIEWGDSNIVHMATNLTPAGQTALFASSVSSTTSTTLKDRDCSVVAYSSGMTLTFTASTGLRQFEILITDCTAGGSINFPDVTYRGASDALTLEAGDNHLVFAEYAANCFFVTRSVANTITIS